MSEEAVIEITNISKYLTRQYLSQQLTKWFEENIEYTKHEFGKSTGKGDSYLSNIYRVKIYGKLLSNDEEVAVDIILKCLPKNEARKKTFRLEEFFRQEINYYLYIMPALSEFQSKKNVDSFQCWPKVFGAVTDGQDDFLALEDLTASNFTSAVRQEGIDYPHCKIILEIFAKFHAISFAYKDQHPEQYEKLKGNLSETYFAAKNWSWFKNFWRDQCVCAIDAVVKEYPGTVYEEKIKAFAVEKTFDRCVDAACENGETGVFSHGDSWTPNFLFRYETGTDMPIDVKMFDFQLGRCASPILDVVFFIYACSTKQLREEFYEPMLKHYHDVLCSRIKALGSDPEKLYPRSVFMDEVKKYSFFGLSFTFDAVPALILDPADAYEVELTGTEVVDVSTLLAVKPIKTKAGRLRLANNIVHAVDNGYI